MESIFPAEQLAPGAVPHGDGRVTFTIYAPNKQSVHLIGSFNDWDKQADPLQSTPDGLWWIEKKLGAGAHTYQFLIDGTLIICDPYARELAEGSENDPPRALVDLDSAAYQWKHDDWQRPAFNDLIIYELHIGSFSLEGTFDGVTKRLDYLADLGINAIELMPVFEAVGHQRWNYDPAYFFAIEKSYGKPNDLRRLIDEAHARGIAIILDIVLTHTGEQHPFNRLYPYEQSPWYGQSMGAPNEFGFPTFDYSKVSAQYFAQDVQRFWLREFHVDGLRYDYLRGLGMRDGMGVPFLVHSAREVRPDVYLIGEYSPEEPHALNATDLNGAWRVGVRNMFVALLREGQIGDLHWDDFGRLISFLDAHNNDYAHFSQAVNYMESHDENRIAWEIRDAGRDPFVKSALGATVLFTMPGEPMLYSGQEWAEASNIVRVERNPIHWEQLDTPEGKQLFEHYRTLCHLRREHPALRGESYAVDAFWNDRQSLVYHRWNDAGDVVVVVANFSPVTQSLEVPFPEGGQWQNVFRNETVTVDKSYGFELAPSSALVFVRAA